ncbi:MAG: hypothetical protein M3O06_10250, partial [Pseudomonadota bacterium]|nr:hypothetical protein [Pseudomonadota bacterium]
MAFKVRAALAVLVLLAAPAVHGGDMCPAPPKRAAAPSPAAADDHLIHVDSDEAMIDADGHARLNGHVQIRQNGRTMSADSMNYDYRSGKLAVKGGVDFEDPKLRVKSDSGNYDTAGGADFDHAAFQIFERNGRGFARRLAASPDGKVQLEQGRYTTCPVGNEDWMLQASSIDLDTDRQQGVGRGVYLRFKNVPVFYTPFISFP